MGGYFLPQPYQGDRIADLMQQRGQIEAQRALQSADIWGRTLSNVGQIAEHYGAQYAAQQKEKQAAAKMAKRDAAWVAYIDSGEWAKDPQGAYKAALRVWGQAGPQQFQALQGVMTLANPKRTPEEAQKAAGLIIQGMEKMGDPARAVLYPQARKLTLSAFPDVQLPEQYDPKVWTEQIAPLGPALLGEKPKGPVVVPAGASLLDENGQLIYTAQRTAAPAAVGSFEDYVVRKYGESPTPEQITEARKAYQQADDRPYRGPVPVVVMTDQGPQILDRSTGTARAIKREGGPDVGLTPTTDERNRVASRQTAQPVLDSIAELSERINTQNGVIAKITGEAEKAKAKANLSDDIAEYQALVSGFTPMLARMVGHTGVLTEQDVQSVRTMLPQPGDSKSVRDRKMARIQKILGAQGVDSSPPMRPPASGGPVRIKSDAEWNALPPGTVFIGPDGVERRK